MKPLFLMFMARDCEDCCKHSKDWIRLAAITNKQFTVGRTDCHFDHDVCEMFRIESYPFILYFKDNTIYRYNGGLSTEALLKYLSVENFKDPKLASVYTADMRDYVSQLDGSHDLGSKLRRMASDGNKWCKSWSNYIFKKIKLSHWSENAKMLIFCMFALGIPAVIATYTIVTAFLSVVYGLNDTFSSKKQRRSPIYY